METQIKQDTLTTELAVWNRQEQQFRELFGEGALKDRSFQRMKLAEYDRLYHKYKNADLSRDDRAMMLMLRYQRERLRKSLYPGLLRRALHRLAARVKGTIEQRRRTTDRGILRTDDLYQVPSLMEKKQEQPKQRSKIRSLPSLRYHAGTNRNNQRRGTHL